MNKVYTSEELLDLPQYQALTTVEKNLLLSLVEHKLITQSLPPFLAITMMRDFQWSLGDFYHLRSAHTTKFYQKILKIMGYLLDNGCLNQRYLVLCHPLNTKTNKKQLPQIFENLKVANLIKPETLERLFFTHYSLNQVSQITKIYRLLAETTDGIEAFNGLLAEVLSLKKLRAIAAGLKALQPLHPHFARGGALKEVTTAQNPARFARILELFGHEWVSQPGLIKMLHDSQEKHNVLLLSLEEMKRDGIPIHFDILKLALSFGSLKYFSATYLILHQAKLMKAATLKKVMAHQNKKSLVSTLQRALDKNMLNQQLLNTLLSTITPKNCLDMIEYLSDKKWLTPKLFLKISELSKNSNHFSEIYAGFKHMRDNQIAVNPSLFETLCDAKNPRLYAEVVLPLSSISPKNTRFFDISMKHVNPKACAKALAFANHHQLLTETVIRKIKLSLRPYAWISIVASIKAKQLLTPLVLEAIPQNHDADAFFEGLCQLETHLDQSILNDFILAGQLEDFPLRGQYPLFSYGIIFLKSAGLYNQDRLFRLIRHPNYSALTQILHLFPPTFRLSPQGFERLISEDRAHLFEFAPIQLFWSRALPSMREEPLFLLILNGADGADTFHLDAFLHWVGIQIDAWLARRQAIQFNYAQSTHNYFVEKAISENATKLLQTYQADLTDIHIPLDSFSQAFEAWIQDKTPVAHCAFKLFSLMRHDENYQNSRSKLTTTQLMASSYLASMEKHSNLSQEDILEKFFNAFIEMYQIEPSLMEDNQFIFTICAGGRFNKLMEKFAEFHPLCQIRFITKQTIVEKLKKLTLHALRESFHAKFEVLGPVEFFIFIKKWMREGMELVWPMVEEKVTLALFEEFAEYVEYSGQLGVNELKDMLKNMVYLDVSLEELHPQLKRGLAEFDDFYDALKHALIKARHHLAPEAFAAILKDLEDKGVASVAQILELVAVPEMYLPVKIAQGLMLLSLKRKAHLGFFAQEDAVEAQEMARPRAL